jgi:hypothetical protein
MTASSAAVTDDVDFASDATDAAVVAKKPNHQADIMSRFGTFRQNLTLRLQV